MCARLVHVRIFYTCVRIVHVQIFYICVEIAHVQIFYTWVRLVHVQIYTCVRLVHVCLRVFILCTNLVNFCYDSYAIIAKIVYAFVCNTYSVAIYVACGSDKHEIHTYAIQHHDIFLHQRLQKYMFSNCVNMHVTHHLTYIA